jgi:hypothetical protein
MSLTIDVHHHILPDLFLTNLHQQPRRGPREFQLGKAARMSAFGP